MSIPCQVHAFSVVYKSYQPLKSTEGQFVTLEWKLAGILMIAEDSLAQPCAFTLSRHASSHKR